jgi:hypothetical protein
MTAFGLADFISDPELLGPWFDGPSWSNWLTVLKAAFAEPMTEAERARFRELADRDPPQSRCRELWCAIGRRGGKDSIASAIATYTAALGDFATYLRPGEKAVILCLAVSREQAAIVFAYIRAYFERVPMLAQLVRRVTGDTIELEHVDVTVATCSYRSIRGRTVALAILDEIAFWRDEGGAYVSPDTEVYSALVPALATLRKAGAMIVGISTVYRKSGLLYSKWREHHGRPHDILVVRAPSITFNPTLDQADIDADIALDPARGEAEWLSEWRSDLADYVDRAVVEALVAHGRHELPPLSGVSYYGFADPSGGSADSYTIAVTHREKSGVSVLDAVREVRPPFSPEAATAEHAAFLKSYGIRSVTGDRYAGEWPREQFSKHGISYEPSERSKSEIYVEILPALNAHKVELLDNARLISQLCGLERKTVRGTGRDTVDHGSGRHDDVCNAACGALLSASRPDALEIWRRMGSDEPSAR